MDEKLLRIGEVAERLAIGESTAWRLIHEVPEFPKPMKIAGATRFRKSDVDSYIAGLTEGQ